MFRTLTLLLLFLFLVEFNLLGQRDLSYLLENFGLVEEHKYLAPFEGKWKLTLEYKTEKGESEYQKGTSDVKLILNYRVAEMHSFVQTSSGLPFEFRFYIGYNSIRKKFFLFALDNYTNNSFFSLGEYNDANKEFVFIGQVDNPKIKKPVEVKYRLHFERENKLIIENFAKNKQKEELIFRAMLIKIPE
jgi:hypothetical protein